MPRKRLVTKAKIRLAMARIGGNKRSIKRSGSRKDERFIISKFNNIWLHTNTDYLREISDTENLASSEEIQHYHWPLVQQAAPSF